MRNTIIDAQDALEAALPSDAAGPARLWPLLETAKKAALQLALGRHGGCAELEDALALEARAAGELAEAAGASEGLGRGARAAAEKAAAGVQGVLAELLEDARAALDRDPAAADLAEVILAYPGFEAAAAYRLARLLRAEGLPLLPRLLCEAAHGRTGIDIHPGARIGSAFFIDHGTGTVIGETAEIGDRVTLYQGVTLGALGFPRDEEGRLLRGVKRHPTVEAGATIYAHAMVLGGETVVGAGAVIGARAFVCRSVPPGARVFAAVRPDREVSR